MATGAGNRNAAAVGSIRLGMTDRGWAPSLDACQAEVRRSGRPSRVCGVEGLRSVAGWEPGLDRKAVVAFMPEALTCLCFMLTDEAWPRALQPAPLLGAAKVCTTLRNHWYRQANDLSEE